MENRVMVFSTTQEYLAGIIAENLKSHGIHALVLNQKDSSYMVFGEIEVYVAIEDEAKAKEIIEKANE